MAFSIGVRMLNPRAAGALGGFGGGRGRLGESFARTPIPSGFRPAQMTGPGVGGNVGMAPMPGGNPPIQGEPKNQPPFTTPAAGAGAGAGSSTPPGSGTSWWSASPGVNYKQGPWETGYGSGPAPGGNVYNLDTDPLVQKIRALNEANYEQATALTQASAKQDLIRSGFSFADIAKGNPSLAASVLGAVLGDKATALAAQNNPYSTRANLARTHTQNDQGIDQATNASNLYYSSTHGNQLGDEAHQYLGRVDQAQTQLQDAFSALIQNLAQVKAGEDQQLAGAYDQARQSYISQMLSSGQTFQGYDANGNPIFG